MSKNRTPRQSTAAPQKAAAAVGRVFKFSFKDIPVVNAAMEARLEAAARRPRKARKDRRYPVIVEAPDA